MLNKLANVSEQLTMLKLKNDQYQQNLSKIKDSQLREQTDQFESLIVKTLLDVSMEDSNKLFGEEAGDKIYQSMFREEISKLSAGSFGISQTLFNFLKKQQDESPTASSVESQPNQDNTKQTPLERNNIPVSKYSPVDYESIHSKNIEQNKPDLASTLQSSEIKPKPQPTSKNSSSKLYDGLELEILGKN